MIHICRRKDTNKGLLAKMVNPKTTYESESTITQIRNNKSNGSSFKSLPDEVTQSLGGLSGMNEDGSASPLSAIGNRNNNNNRFNYRSKN